MLGTNFLRYFMRQFLFKALLALTCCASTVTVAADYCCDPCPGPCDPCDPCCDPCGNCWEGFYVSGQLGGGWHRDEIKFRNANFFNTIGAEVLGNKFTLDSDGFVGGGALGYNYQCGSFVVGVEGGALGMDLKRDRRSPFFPDTDRFSTKLDWLGFAKLRVGFAYDCFLGYVSGGWAGSNLHIKLEDRTDPALPIVARSNKWINGWTVGAGVEYKLCSWSFGLGYDFVQLEDNKRNPSCVDCGEGIGFGSPRLKNDSQLQLLTLRINYYFNLF